MNFKKFFGLFLSIIIMSNLVTITSSATINNENMIPTNAEAKAFMEEYYKNNNKETTEIKYVSDKEILELKQALNNFKNVKPLSDLASKSISPRSAKYSVNIPPQIKDWVFTGKSTKTNYVVFGTNYAYVFTRVGFNGGTYTMITDIAFCELVKNAVAGKNNTEVTYQIELTDKVEVIYNTVDEEIIDVTDGVQILDDIKMGMSIIRNKSAIIYEITAMIYGTKNGKFSGWNIIQAGLAGCPYTSACYYSYQELTKNIFSQKDIYRKKYDSDRLQWKVFPYTAEEQLKLASLNGNCMRAIDFEFSGRSLEDIGEYAVCKMKVNENITKSNVQLFLSVGN